MKQSESKIQSEFVLWMRNEKKVPRGLFFSIPNDGQFLSKFIATGLVSGFPDLCFLHNKTAHFFETKTPEGRLSAKQIDVHNILTEAGFNVYVVRTFDDFKQIIEQILIL